MKRHAWFTHPKGVPHADDDCMDCGAQRRDMPTPCRNLLQERADALGRRLARNIPAPYGNKEGA